MKKLGMTAATIFVLVLSLAATSGAATITINSINGWTPVSFSLGEITYDVYAGEFQVDIDGTPTAGYCVDLFTHTYLGTSLSHVSFNTLDYITNGARAAWLMDRYSGGSATENAALQLAIWSLQYGSGDSPFRYLGSKLEGSVGYYLESYLSSLEGNSYSGNGYQVVELSPNAQDLLVKTPAPVPEPATLLLIGSGLLGLAGFRKLSGR